jgi:hypothetical protein
MSETDTLSGVEAAREWLEWLYGNQPNGLIWIGGHVNWRGATFSSPMDAARYAMALDAAGGIGVYHRLTTMREVGKGRGEVEDSISLPALMMDIDLLGPGHKAQTYPVTKDDVDKVFALAGVPEPTRWIHSGGGLYAAWRLDQPVEVAAGGETLKVAQESARALQRKVIDAAKELGFKIDNTSDLARVFRLPGTTNRKIEGVHTLARVVPGQGAGCGYALGELAGARVTAAESMTVDKPAANDLDRASPPTQSSLFAGPEAYTDPSRTRSFTLAEAMAFVAPALTALRGAADGEINVRLNEAACTLAHFGPEFWSEEAADRQLDEALSATAYDGRTWKAGDTIASARRAMSAADQWRGVLLPGPGEALAAAGDLVDALLAEMLEPDEIISRPPPRYLIHGLLQFDSESWVIGPPGSRKSFVVLDMACRVARGEAWQGRRVHAADVVMIVAEGAGGVGKRLKAWEQANGRIPAGSLRILPRPVQAGDTMAWAVLTEACRRLAVDAYERGRGMLVILDTQARVTVGLKENDATDMGVFVGAVSAIRAATAGCVLSVHHTGRAGGDARGSSAIDGAQTTELKVTSKGKLTGQLSVEKQKDIEEIEPIRLAFTSVTVGQDEDGMDVTSLVLADQESAAFKVAWEDGEAPGDAESAEIQKEVNPFSVRVVVDAWIRERTTSLVEQWAMQVLWDVAEDLGLTGAQVRKMVAEKMKTATIKDGTWYTAWQRITNTTKEEAAKRRWNDVVRPAGGQRWTVDKSALGGLEN